MLLLIVHAFREQDFFLLDEIQMPPTSPTHPNLFNWSLQRLLLPPRLCHLLWLRITCIDLYYPSERKQVTSNNMKHLWTHKAPQPFLHLLLHVSAVIHVHIVLKVLDSSSKVVNAFIV